MSIIPVILSGGSGTRLWPLSRKTYPKQFLKLVGDQSLFSTTLERVKGISDFQPVIVSSEQHRFMVAEQLRQAELDKATILLEPVARNTAPAIAAAAIQVKNMQLGDNTLMLVLPADHNIIDVDAFHKAVKKGVASAEAGKLVTFGIVPKQPETGFGYIKAANENNHGSLDVAKFVEKPDLETAKQYLDSGDYFWNSGMFLFSPNAFLEELNKNSSSMVEACQKAVDDGVVDLDFIRLNEDSFGQSPEDSIDYAVMEKTLKAAVVPLDAGWSDVGSWPALAAIQEQDDNGNATHGDVVLQDTRNCMVYSEDRLVSAIGVEDLVIVETLDAILVTTKSKAQEVGKIVKTLKINERTEATAHRKIYRPWGNYDSIDGGDRFQVKRITVSPGGELSLQKHFHRAEHWIVVSGTAEVTCDDKIIMLHENQSTYIPLGSVHRLANRGKIPLELIEVQSGSYLGEDDIVRLEDNYGRSGTNT